MNLNNRRRRKPQYEGRLATLELVLLLIVFLLLIYLGLSFAAVLACDSGVLC